MSLELAIYCAFGRHLGPTPLAPASVDQIPQHPPGTSGFAQNAFPTKKRRSKRPRKPAMCRLLSGKGSRISMSKKNRCTFEGDRTTFKMGYFAPTT